VGDGIAASDDHPGVQTEAGILRDLLYEDRQLWTPRILPVLLPGRSVSELPYFVLGHTLDRYSVTSFTADGARDLLDVLTGRRPRQRPRLKSAKFRDRYGAGPAAIEEAAEELARQVELQWRTDEARREHLSPTLPIRWAVTAAAEAAMTGAWDADQVPELENLGGQFGSIASVFTQQLPHHRLAILGESGAGKSALAVRLVRDLASERAAGGLVPVLFDAATWDPDQQTLTGWLAQELARNFDGLTRKAPFASARPPTMAAALVDGGRILPVIDGLDTIGPGPRPKAIAELGSHDRPFVVTSQPGPYQQAITERGRGLARTAVVELLPLAHDELPNHLEPLGNAGWQRMLGCLRDDPHGPLGQALRTPLMIWLLRTMYRKPDADASALCEQNRFPDPEAIAAHLLDGFVPASYDERPPPAARRRTDDRWLSDDVHRWLSFLARHARAENGPDLHWWRLYRAAPPLEPLLGMVATFLFGFALGGLFVNTGFGVALGALLAGLRASPRALKALGVVFTDQPRKFETSARRARWTAFAAVRLTLRLTLPLLAGFTLLYLWSYGIGFTIAGVVVVVAALAQLVWYAIRKPRELDTKRELVVPTELPKARNPPSVLRADRQAALLPAIIMLLLATPVSLATRHPFAVIIGGRAA
jgi:hypothetical protein